jgi:hypothetical protein
MLRFVPNEGFRHELAEAHKDLSIDFLSPLSIDFLSPLSIDFLSPLSIDSVGSAGPPGACPEPPPREPNCTDSGLVPPRPAPGAAARGGGNLTDCGLVQKRWKTSQAGRSLQMAR